MPIQTSKCEPPLERAAAFIGGIFVKQPLVEASIRQTIGKAYHALVLYPGAQRQMERALDLRYGFLARTILIRSTQ